MELSEFTLRLFILFLPGVIAYLIVLYLATYTKISPFFFVIYSFVLGFISYLVYHIILFLINQIFCTVYSVTFFIMLFSESSSYNVPEIILVCLIAIVLGMIISFSINKNLLYRLSKALNITKKFPEEDVWHHIFNSEDNINWVDVRDLKHGFIFRGWVSNFSDIPGENELFIRDVMVYDDSGTKLYDSPGVYISRDRHDLLIDFPGLNFTDLHQKSNEENKEI